MTRFTLRNDGRKFRLAALTVLLGSALLYVGSLTSEAWAATVSAVVLAYIAGNVVQKRAPAGAQEARE